MKLSQSYYIPNFSFKCLSFFKDTTIQGTQPVLEASLEEASTEKTLPIQEDTIVPVVSSTIDETIDVLSKLATKQVTQPTLEASVRETSPDKPSSINEAAILPIVSQIIDEPDDDSSKCATMQETSAVLEECRVEEAAGKTC